MKFTGKTLMLLISLLLFAAKVNAAATESKWLQLDADSKERIRSIIQSDVERRTGFSTAEEERINTDMVENERQKENKAYKAAIDSASNTFQRTKKRADDLTAQYQTMAYDFEESTKNVGNIQSSITNIDNQIARYRQDIDTQQKSLAKSLKTTKLGEAVVAVLYTRGFVDSAHKLERQADQASAPLIVEHMGTYIQSFSEVINNVLTEDFIRAVEEGTAKWDRKEPFRIALDKGSQGTTYLRIKRYELYPFQSPERSALRGNAGKLKAKTVLINSMGDLTSFLSENNLSAKKHDLSRVDSMIGEAKVVNKQAAANHREQLISFRERIDYLEKKISAAQTDRQSLETILAQKKPRMKKMKSELEVLKLKKESADLAFQNAQAALIEKKRVHESIIIKTSLVVVKRSETPAEASAEAVIEELKDVLNDARIQHYTSTTDVMNGKLVAESKNQSITKAKIMAVRPLAFINEGDSIRVKIAFRVRTILDTSKEMMAAKKTKDQPIHSKQKTPKPPPKRPATKKPIYKPPVKKPVPPVAVNKKRTPSTVPLKSVASTRALDFLFKLKDIRKSGNRLKIRVKATNLAGYDQYPAFYDRTSRYERSSISGKGIPLTEVHQVYLWQGEQKTAAVDAYRGVQVRPGEAIIVELIFKSTPGAGAILSKLNLVTYVGTLSFIRSYSWKTQTVTFKNIRLP